MSGEYILVAEDNSGDVFLIREALDPLGVPLRVFTDGDEAIAAIDALDADPSQPAPLMALLDLNLPKRPGIDVLRRLRSSRNIGGTPVVIITSSDYQQDRERTAALGATYYFRKPSDLDEFLQLGELVRQLLHGGLDQSSQG